MYQNKDPLLDLILNKYIQTSKDSIYGPVALKEDGNKLVTKSPLNNKKTPEIPDESKLIPTNLESFNLASFIVGGEKRLCFTELVQTVLKDVNMQEIFKKRDQLLIFTSKCTQKQLDELKYHGIIPWTSTSSNLITKSDAYRLCGALQGPLALKSEVNKHSPLSFEVYHECFGGCIGHFLPELYNEVDSPCIKCSECDGLFCSEKFVSHNHSSYDEVHTCHWGFDSTNWRIYLMLVEQTPTRDLVAMWESVKNKFDANGNRIHTSFISSSRLQDAEFVAYVNSPDDKKAMVSPIENLRNIESRINHKRKKKSAFRPWSPIQSSSNYQNEDNEGHRENSSHSSHFIFPSTNKLRGKDTSSYSDHTCTQCPKSSTYLNCEQCKRAAKASCPGRFQQSSKPLEKTEEHHHDRREQSCKCEKCFSNKTDEEKLEGQFEEIINTFISRDKQLTTTSKDLARLLSSQVKTIYTSQNEKVKEFSISSQRLQTELQLVKMESQRELREARETRVHAEQELETLHRKRQQEMSLFNQLTFQLEQDVEHRKASGNSSDVETIQKEVTLLRAHLQQTTIDKENLEKQLEFLATRRNNSSWTPYPTIGKQFSDSEEEDVKANIRTSRSDWSKRTISASSGPCVSRREYSDSLSPATKSPKLDKDHSEDDDSDIEVDD